MDETDSDMPAGCSSGSCDDMQVLDMCALENNLSVIFRIGAILLPRDTWNAINALLSN